MKDTNTPGSEQSTQPPRNTAQIVLLVVIALICAGNLVFTILSFVGQKEWFSKELFVNDNGRVVRAHEDSRMALKYAEALVSEAGESGLSGAEAEMAKLYLLNAIQQDPGLMEPLSAYVDFVLKTYGGDLNVLGQAKSVVQASLFQLKADEMHTGIELLERLTVQESAQLTLNSVPEPLPVDWAAELSKVNAVPVNDIALDTDALGARAEALYAIYQEASDRGEFDVADTLEAEIANLNETLRMATLAQRIGQYLDFVEKADVKTSRQASARMLSASTLLSEFWIVDASTLPGALFLEAEELDQRLNTIQEGIAQKQVDAICAKQTKRIQDAFAKSKKEQKYQSKIDLLTKALTEASSATAGLKRDALSTDFIDQIESAQKSIIEHQRKQYANYQKWAVIKCENFLNSWKGLNVSNGEARRFFKDEKIAEIDLRLLSPETHMVYSRVMQKLNGELPGDEAFAIDKAVSLTPKKQLEAF